MLSVAKTQNLPKFIYKKEIQYVYKQKIIQVI